MSIQLMPSGTLQVKPDDVAIDGAPRPVSWRVADYPGNLEIASHKHHRAQLIYASAGVMSVETEHGIWVVPPQRAVWVPGDITHAVRSRDGISMRSLYFEPTLVGGLSNACMVVSVSPFFRELTKAVVALPILYEEADKDGRLISVLLDQLHSMIQTPLHLPIGSDKRLKPVLVALADNPADNRSIGSWALSVGVSERTLSRLFVSQTGLTFRTWRQQARLLSALGRLATGESVARVSQDLGYESQSAFIVMFKRTLGTTPGKYFSDL